MHSDDDVNATNVKKEQNVKTTKTAARGDVYFDLEVTDDIILYSLFASTGLKNNNYFFEGEFVIHDCFKLLEAKTKQNKRTLEDILLSKGKEKRNSLVKGFDNFSYYS